MESLETVYTKSRSISDIQGIPGYINDYVVRIGEACTRKKGLYTVLTTLLYYKYLHPEQDIRYHQDRFERGFSGRSFDTNYVTPVLRKLRLPAMAESGWLTRSLEQPYPYTFDYNGSIGELKTPFLTILDYVEKKPQKAYDLLRILLNAVDKIAQANRIKITPLDNPENLTITRIILALEEHFLFQYGTHNGAKLPVLAFHAIYTSLINEIKRYDQCTLAPLSSLTACDRTNKASGDIEIFKDGKVFETIEIKLDKKIDAPIIRNVELKVYKWNPQRYYVLSVLGVQEGSEKEIEGIIQNVLINHGCQIIINGLIPTIKYYLRLIEDLNTFIINYSKAIEEDEELQIVHKNKWNELLEKYQL